MLTTIGYQWKPMARIFNLGEQFSLTRFTHPKVVPAMQPKNVSTNKSVIIENSSHTSWKPLTRYQRRNKPNKVIQIVLWYSNSGCSKHMIGDRSRLRNFIKKFIGTVRFGNDHFGAIMGYGDYVIGNSVISRVYYVKGLGHNLFSVGQIYDSNLEVAFRKHSCYVRDSNGVKLIKDSRGYNLYTISVEDIMKSSPICLLSKASKTKSWLWHRVGIFHQKSVPRTPQQNGIVERRNHTLVEATRTMLIFSEALMFLWVEVVATAYYTQNQSLIHTRHNKTPYELVHNKKPYFTFLRVFGTLCYPTNSEDLGKLQPTADIDAPSLSRLPSSSAFQSPCLHQGVATESTLMDGNPFAPVDNDPFINIFASEPTSEEKLVFQHDEVLGIHQTSVGIISPALYLLGVHKVLQGLDWGNKEHQNSEKGKIRLLIMHQLIWGFVMASVN
nr:integrase, catalytic region, zinc finger, CCHC-type, peptidase aspartic, catalytic [Tanacetum cinerariifolium]